MDLKRMMKEKVAVQGKSRHTFKTYWVHCEDYLSFCRQRKIGRETKAEVAVENWLTSMAVDKKASKSTQNTALQAVCYLYREIFDRPLVGVSAFRSKRPQMVRDIISVEQVARLFTELSGVNLLAAQLMYATGLRVGLVSELRLKDLSFDRNQITVHNGKGDKGRYVSFPEIMHDAVRMQIESVKTIHRWDCDGNNPNGVSLPDNFRSKSHSSANQLKWQYLFPSDSLSRIDGGPLCRHHRLPDGFTDAIRKASEIAGIEQRVTSHILRHSYATHAHEMGVPMRTLQLLLGHNDIRTTEIYVHASKDGATASRSPIESLAGSLQRPVNSSSKKVSVRDRPALKLFAG